MGGRSSFGCSAAWGVVGSDRGSRTELVALTWACWGGMSVGISGAVIRGEGRTADACGGSGCASWAASRRTASMSASETPLVLRNSDFCSAECFCTSGSWRNLRARSIVVVGGSGLGCSVSSVAVGGGVVCQAGAAALDSSFWSPMVVCVWTVMVGCVFRIAFIGSLVMFCKVGE